MLCCSEQLVIYLGIYESQSSKETLSTKDRASVSNLPVKFVWIFMRNQTKVWLTQEESNCEDLRGGVYSYMKPAPELVSRQVWEADVIVVDRDFLFIYYFFFGDILSMLTDLLEDK